MPWRLERHEKDAVFKEVSVVFEDLEHRSRWNVDRSNIKEILNTVYQRITDEMEASRRTKTDDEDRSFMRKKMSNLVENLSHPPPSSNNGGGHKRPAEGNGGDDRGGGRQRADNGYANGSFGGASSHVVAVPPTIAMLADQDERERPAALKNLPLHRCHLCPSLVEDASRRLAAHHTTAAAHLTEPAVEHTAVVDHERRALAGLDA